MITQQTDSGFETQSIPPLAGFLRKPMTKRNYISSEMQVIAEQLNELYSIKRGSMKQEYSHHYRNRQGICFDREILELQRKLRC